MLNLKQLYQEFRNPEVIQALSVSIRQEAELLSAPLDILEVCGGHTHAIMKYGLKQLLPDNIDFIHGPGCPICIMPKERIDQAIALARLPDVMLVTLGDLIRVPGSTGSLAQTRALGCDVRPVYSPLEALRLAADNPDKSVVFFAFGFETSTPMTAALIEETHRRSLSNLYFHINHVLVPPAIEFTLRSADLSRTAVIGPSHVSVITGADTFRKTAKDFAVPFVVAGFEPVDILDAILRIVQQKVSGQTGFENQYSRSVTEQGNLSAQNTVNKYLEVRTRFRWRGLGYLPDSAMKLKSEFSHLDAEQVFAEHLITDEQQDNKACLCGSVLTGKSKPSECRLFGKACKPISPLGSCMVSSEGACNAYYRYHGVHSDEQ